MASPSSPRSPPLVTLALRSRRGLAAVVPSRRTTHARPSCAATNRRPDPSWGAAIARGPPGTEAKGRSVIEMALGSKVAGEGPSDRAGDPDPLAVGELAADGLDAGWDGLPVGAGEAEVQPAVSATTASAAMRLRGTTGRT